MVNTDLEVIIVQLARFFQKVVRFMESDDNAWTIAPYLPYTTMNNIWRALDKKSASILDVGGGYGRPMRFLKRKHEFQFTVNMDANLRCLRKTKEKRTHDEYILCDVRYLPFKRKSFDVAICVEVLEHIEKEGGLSLLSALDEIVRKQIVLTTNVEPALTPVLERRIGKPMGHVSSWHPSEFKRLGYKVRGSSFPTVIRGKRLFSLSAGSHNPLIVLVRILDVVAGPFVYFFPSRAGHQIAIKYLDKKSK